MKKIRTICLILCCVLLLTPMGVSAQGQRVDQSVENGCHSVDAKMQLSEEGKLTDTAKAVIVYELGSDTMIYTWNPDEKIYPSSMVKLMTALIALEKGQLTDRVVVTKRALSHVAIGSVSAGLTAGEELTLEDLLYCLMVPSANDAATVIAEHIGGSQDGFVKLMNQRAQELGCLSTNYTNAHGLHDSEMYTTARDICRLMDAALENPEFRKMFCTESYTVPATNKSEAREVYTSNYMMSDHTIKKYYDPRVTGGKTGATDEAGRCLVATSEGKGMELLTIVMGAQPTYEPGGLALKTFGSFEETKVLLDHALEKYEYRQIFYEGQTISQHPVEGGTNDVATKPEKTASTVLPVDIDVNKLNWIYGDNIGTLTAPIAKDQAISVIQVWYGSKCLAQTNLVAANAVEVWKAPVIPERNTSGDDGSWVTAGILLAVFALVALIVAAVVFFRGRILFMLDEARRRRRRRNRRRSR